MWCSTSSSRDHRSSGTSAGLRRSKSSLSIQRSQPDFLSCGRPAPSQALLADPSCHWARRPRGGGQRRAKLLTAESHLAALGRKNEFFLGNTCTTTRPGFVLRLSWGCATGTAELSPRSSWLSSQNWCTRSKNCHTYLTDTFRYLPQVFPAPVQISALHPPEHVLLGKLRSKTAACVVLPTGFTAEMESEFLSGRGVRKAVGSPLWRTWFWGFPFHISIISSEVLPKTAALQHQSRRKPHCCASVWLLYQSHRALQNIQSLALIKHQCH